MAIDVNGLSREAVPPKFKATKAVPRREANPPESVTQNSASATPPTITINVDNPTIIEVDDSTLLIWIIE